MKSRALSGDSEAWADQVVRAFERIEVAVDNGPARPTTSERLIVLVLKRGLEWMRPAVERLRPEKK